MVDNPLCAGTGHRICNDCNEVVHLPEANAGEHSARSKRASCPMCCSCPMALKSTRCWRAGTLSICAGPRPCPTTARTFCGRHGPAGYTLAHHLLNDALGWSASTVCASNPCPCACAAPSGACPNRSKDVNDITGPLDRRTILGFGGVSEYGITVRWDKKLPGHQLSAVERRKKFRLYDGIRFGGTLTLDDAWGLGFEPRGHLRWRWQADPGNDEKQPAARRAPGL